MKLGEVFSAQVRGLTSEGNGVVEHASGRVVFVPGTWPGEQVQVKITALKNQFAQGRLLALLQGHPERRSPPCVHQGFGLGHCGGCPWQFIAYPAQLAAKQERIVQTLHRFAPKARIEPIWAAPAEFGYRNRAQLKTDGKALGFVASASHQLAPVVDCLVLDEPTRAHMQELRAQLPNPEWQQAAKRQLATLDISASSFSLNKRLPFAQGNAAQNTRMHQWLLEQLLPLPKTAPLLELFAGSGNFTRCLSELGFSEITAVEVAEEALHQLRNLSLPGVTPVAADLFQPEQLKRLLKRSQAQVLVLDPPRDGLKHAQEIIAKQTALSHIFYISCDLATFARDCALLCKQGFKLETVQPLDQFPQTPHVELLARLVRA